jgi:hypothetical protein
MFRIRYAYWWKMMYSSIGIASNSKVLTSSSDLCQQHPCCDFTMLMNRLLFRSIPVLKDWAWSYCKTDSLSRTVPKHLVPKTLQREITQITSWYSEDQTACPWDSLLVNNDIQHFISNCSICNKFWKANTREPLKPHDIPSRPWTKLGADLMEFKGKNYLLCVDYYSKYPEIALLPSSASTISAFQVYVCETWNPCGGSKWQWTSICVCKFQRFRERMGLYSYNLKSMISPIQRGSKTFCANRERHVQ